jgi:hypothetical protein
MSQHIEGNFDYYLNYQRVSEFHLVVLSDACNPGVTSVNGDFHIHIKYKSTAEKGYESANK